MINEMYSRNATPPHSNHFIEICLDVSYFPIGKLSLGKSPLGKMPLGNYQTTYLHEGVDSYLKESTLGGYRDQAIMISEVMSIQHKSSQLRSHYNILFIVSNKIFIISKSFL